MLPVIHYAHLLFGTLWLGGTLTLAVAVYPALARMDAAGAGRLDAAIGAVAGPLLGASGGLTLLIGPLRAWMGGGVTGLADLVAPYGLLVLAAFVLMVAAEGAGGGFRRKFRGLLADPAGFAAAAPALAGRHALLTTALSLGLVTIMVALDLGLY